MGGLRGRGRAQGSGLVAHVLEQKQLPGLKEKRTSLELDLVADDSIVHVLEHGDGHSGPLAGLPRVDLHKVRLSLGFGV